MAYTRKSRPRNHIVRALIQAPKRNAGKHGNSKKAYTRKPKHPINPLKSLNHTEG